MKFEVNDVPHIKSSLPELSFWRLKAQREPHPRHLNNNLNGENGGIYKSKKFKKHQNETWERGKTHSNNYGENNHKLDHFTRRGARHGFARAEELDSLSNDKISQLLGEGPDELEPEWDAEIIGDGKIGKSSGGGGEGGADDDLAHMSMMNMGQTVEDFEKWKYQMKLQERRRKGEVVDEEVEQQKLADDESAAKNAGNEVDNFFSFIKPTHKEPDFDEEVVVSATVEELALKQMQAPLQATMLAIGLLVSHHFFNNQIRRRQLNKLTRALSINRNRLLRWQLCLLHQDFQSFLEVKRVVHKHHNIPQSPLC